MPNNKWEIVESSLPAVNTALAAAATEVLISAPLRVDLYNSFICINGNDVAVELRLDNDSTRPIPLLAKTAAVLEAEEGRFFKSILQINKDAAAAETAGALTILAFKKIKVAD